MRIFTRAEEVEQYCREVCNKAERDATYATIAAHIVTQDQPR
jgi:hypothetical protein